MDSLFGQPPGFKLLAERTMVFSPPSLVLFLLGYWNLAVPVSQRALFSMYQGLILFLTSE